jgi:hypothetical protein
VIKVTSAMHQPVDTAAIASIERVAGRPTLTPRPKSVVPLAAGVARIPTTAEYAAAMKSLGSALGAINKWILSGAANDARSQTAQARATMQAIEGFWADRKKDEPAMLARTTLEKVDALDEALAGGETAEMQAGFKELATACGACHMKYREQDPATKAFSIKPGTL